MSRLLIGLLLALSFSVFAADPPPYVQPKQGQELQWTCMFSPVPTKTGLSLDACQSYLKPAIEQIYGAKSSYTQYSVSDFQWHETSAGSRYDLYFHRTSETCVPNQPCTSYDYGIITDAYARAVTPVNVATKTCPPDDLPEYKVGPTTYDPGDGSAPVEDVCVPQFKLCGAGYFRYAVTTSSGVTQCVPVGCPNAGTAKSVWTYNIIQKGFSGTYCDGACAYSVLPDSSFSPSNDAVSGVSLGAVCGDSRNAKNAWSTPDSNKDCTTTPTDAGQPFIDCSGGPIKNDPDPEEPPAVEGPDTNSSLVDPDETINHSPAEDCSISADSVTCIGNNLKDTLDKNSDEEQKKAAERHNKLIESQTEISKWLEEQAIAREARNNQVASYNTDSIVGAIGGLGTVIVGNGNGTDDTAEDLTEDFDPTPLLDGFQNTLNSGNDQINAAYQDLKNAIDENKDRYGSGSTEWDIYKNLPNHLPSEAACVPFHFEVGSHQFDIDLCQYDSIIKSAWGFLLVFLTAWRLFYIVQNIVRSATIIVG